MQAMHKMCSTHHKHTAHDGNVVQHYMPGTPQASKERCLPTGVIHVGSHVYADNMHSNVRLYTSSTLECSHYLCGSLG